MTLWIFLPLIFGAGAVLQAGLNRRMTQMNDLPFAVWMNSLVLFTLASLVFFISRYRPHWLPEAFEPRILTELPTWALVPGFLGLMLVAGLPVSIGQMGAARTFLLLIAGQLLTSLCWDYFAEGMGVSPARAGAIALTLGAVFLSSR